MIIVASVKNYFSWLSEIGHQKYYRTNLLLWFALVSTNIIDLVYTYHVLSRNGVEYNPFMAFLCSNLGNISLAFYKGLLLGMLFILLPFIQNRLQKLLCFPVVVYVILTISHLIRFH